MSKVMYCRKFFVTEAEARQFIRQNGYGVLYKNTPRSQSKAAFALEAQFSGLSQQELTGKNYCVAWNHRA